MLEIVSPSSPSIMDLYLENTEKRSIYLSVVLVFEREGMQCMCKIDCKGLARDFLCMKRYENKIEKSKQKNKQTIPYFLFVTKVSKVIFVRAHLNN